jgi:hypothetical protein
MLGRAWVGWSTDGPRCALRPAVATASFTEIEQFRRVEVVVG